MQAAIELSQERARVIGTGDVSLLETVDVADGPAAVADARLLAGLDGARVDGLDGRRAGRLARRRRTAAAATRPTSP